MEIQQQITAFLQESRYFPVHIGEIAKITGQRNNFLTPILGDLVKNKDLVQIETDKYYHAGNFIWLANKLIDVLKNFHKNYPYLEGMKKGDLRKAINNKKSQNNVHELIFDRAFELACQDKTVINSNCYFKLQNQSVYQDDQYRSNSQTLMNYFNFRQDLNRICVLSDLADKLKIDSRHLRNILDDLIKSGEITKLYDNMYLGRQHLNRLKDKVIAHIQQNGFLTTLEAKELFAGPRRTTIAILEYFDGKGITKWQESYRILL